MAIFGFIVPPVRESDQTPADDEMPRRLIALDNGRYCVIDLQAPSENETKKTLVNIHTGIGGYMPRYVTSLIEENSFSLTTMCQTPDFNDQYLAHFVLNEKCEP